jgi:quercetin dioxygenase-like cupin family protein
MSSSHPAKAKLSEREAVAPHSGERFVFTRTGAESGGEVLAFDFFVEPRGGVPMKHCHGGQTEIFRCLRGELTVTIGGETRTLRPGEEVVLSPGTVHSLFNAGEEEVQCEVEYRPAGRNEDWFKLMSGFAWKHGREMGVLDLAPFLGDVDLYVDGPPKWLQRLLFAGLLKPLALALGRRERVLAAASEAYGRPFAW